ncbi:MAG: YbhB/YbcL family Raf kinase inhibitor-like protein [Burkholderiaceae bacterium]|nr:YbhB/YbcL family Raf kinase inhibitor-like protein [Burkholderiaceae bacterium]
MKTFATQLVIGLSLAVSVGLSAAADFKVTSADARDGRFGQPQFAGVFGCTGGNVSPQISWSGAPAGTKSFLVSIHDRSAMTGSGWWHWVVANIPANVSELPHGAGSDPAKLPAGALQTLTDAGVAGYGGPCPPVGETHEYVITVKALKVEKLPLPPVATGAMTGMLSNINSLAQASIVVKAGR